MSTITSNSSNMADALEALRLAEKQIDDYREALMEAEDGLGDGTEPDDVRTRIHLALRRKEYVGDRIRATISRCSSPETLPPRITVMDDGRAMGGSDVCHTCEAHCTVINDLQTALRGLYWDNVDYLTLNKLDGMQNHWMRAARLALGMDADDTRPTQKASEGRS